MSSSPVPEPKFEEDGAVALPLLAPEDALRSRDRLRVYRAHRGEHAVGGAQLLSGVGAAALAAQPLSVHEVGAGQVGGDRCPVEAADRLGVEVHGLAASITSGSIHGATADTRASAQSRTVSSATS
jgi:hypothetical protein